MLQDSVVVYMYVSTCMLCMHVRTYMYIHTSVGYDSDVEREKKMDYVSKTYADPIRDAATSATHAGTTGASGGGGGGGGGGGDGGAARNKPHLQASAEESSKDAAGRPPAPIVRRSTTVSPKVSSTIQEGKGKDVKVCSCVCVCDVCDVCVCVCVWVGGRGEGDRGREGERGGRKREVHVCTVLLD